MYTDELFERYLKENVLMTSEVGEILGVSKQQVSNLVKQGKIKPFKVNANSSLFLKTNIDEYIATKLSNPTFRDNKVIGDGNTLRSKDHFDSIRELHKDVQEVHLYFNKQDAIFDGYFCLDDRYQTDTLLRLDAPTCVLKLHNGESIWYDGFNCGYGGTGPNGSYDLLVDLGVTNEVAKKLFESRKISFYKEGAIWEAVDRAGTIANPEYPMKDSDVCLFNRELVLVQNKPEKYEIETKCIEFIDRYSFFIPRPIEVTFYSREEAINTGHFTTSINHSAVYQVVIKDASGSELWLDSAVDEGQPINKQQNLECILNKVGISVPKGTESLSEKIKTWLGIAPIITDKVTYKKNE